MNIVTVNPGTFYKFTKTATDVLNVGVKGGGGILMTRGSTGVVRVLDCAQLETCSGYCGYVGPEVHEDKDAAGNTIVYTEKYTEKVEIYRFDGRKGSAWDALWRFVGFNSVYISGKLINGRCLWADTEEQSATLPGGRPAVTNDVIRVHHGGTFLAEDQNFKGYVFIGPLTGGDGGIKTNGAKRAFYEAARTHSVTYRRCDFDAYTFAIAPGVDQMLLEDVNITVRGNAIFLTDFPYMTRPASMVVLRRCHMSSTTTKTPILFSNAAGAVNMRVDVGCTLQGKKL